MIKERISGNQAVKKYEANAEKSVIWDFDGTIGDSFLAIRETWKSVCTESKLPIPTDGQIKSLMGVPLGLIAEKLNANNIISNAELVKKYKIEFENYAKLIKPFKGIKEALIELSRAEIPMFVVSARTSTSLNQILKNLGLKGYFWEIVGAEDVVKPKPNQEAINTIARLFGLHYEGIYVVGDAEADLQMANNAGVKSIIVTWGSLSEHKLKSLEIQPTHTIKDPKEIHKIISN